MLVFGASLNFYTTSKGTFFPDVPLIQVDADRSHIGRWHPADIAIVGDARLVAEQSCRGSPERDPADKPFHAPRDPRRDRRLRHGQPTSSQPTPPAPSIRARSRSGSARLLPKRRNLVYDAGNFLMAACYVPVAGPQHFRFTSDFASMGAGFGTALGVAAARPDETTVLIVGDGGFMMTLQELETVARLALPIIVVVFNDCAYGAELQMCRIADLPEATSLFPDIDFAPVAESFGFTAAHDPLARRTSTAAATCCRQLRRADPAGLQSQCRRAGAVHRGAGRQEALARRMIVSGFDVRLRPAQRYVTVEDYRRAARRKLPNFVWAYLDGGAEDLVTLRENRTGFSAWSLRSRVLTGAGAPDLSTTVGGAEISLPVMIAPTGYTGLTHWQGELSAIRAAEAAGTRLVASTASSYSLEELAAAAKHAHGFQLYPREGDLATRLMHRAWQAGYRNLFVTVDVPVVGLRESESRMGMGMPPAMTPQRMLNIARHPRWAFRALRHKRMAGRNLVSTSSLAAAAESLSIQARELVQATLNWDDFAWMRDQWKGRLYIKGVLDPQDAVRAVSLGADGVVVSNHGGRQLDYAVASISALPAVVDAVGGRAEIILDSGVRRGTDVIKALALGAKAVLIGRPYIYGLAVEGQRGVERVLEIFRSEMERALILMGVGSVRELDRSWLIARTGRSDNSADPSTLFNRTIRPHFR